jgi:hypothetical protein
MRSGLGRYGDELNPYGDLLRMKALKSFLKPDGLFYLSVPLGADILVFNAYIIIMSKVLGVLKYRVFHT